jgi:hypothetical protein
MLSNLNLQELGHIDHHSTGQSWEDVHEGPVAPSLDLSVVVRSTDSQVSLNTNSYDQVDTGTETDPATQELGKHTGLFQCTFNMLQLRLGRGITPNGPIRAKQVIQSSFVIG